MELQKIIVLCVIGVVVIGGGWYLLNTAGDDSDIAVRTTETQNADTDDSALDGAPDEESLSGQGSMRDLLGTGRNIRCEYTYVENESDTRGSGVSYIAGQRLRVDSDLIQDGQTYESHIINNGEHLWTWTKTSEGTFAFVTTVDETETDYDSYDSGIPSTEGTADTLENDVEYSCKPWRVDENVFTPPTDIDFTNPAQMMQDAMQDLPGEMSEEMQQMMNGAWSQ